MSRKLKSCNPEAWGLSKCAFLLFPTFCFSLFSFCAAAQGVTKYGESTVTSTNFVDLNGKIGNSMALDKGGHILPLPCNTFAVTHTAGAVAPVTKTITYGVVRTTLSGASKCWITQNLGADNQAISATDATDAAAGWYWQFNRKQGYLCSISGTGHIPASWIASISEASDWLPANDPCTLELGTSWRIPTSTEWTNADGAPQNWNNNTNAYASVLKLHAAGSLDRSNGSLSARGAYGYYWGNTQANATTGRYLYFDNIYSLLDGNYKTYGFSVRCLRDDSPPAFSCGSALAVTHTLGDGVAPVTKTVNYGTVTTTLSGANKCWITQNLGSDHQAGSEIDNTEASAGWYWQFNYKQGYIGPAPAWTITSITEASDWLPANDPCALELGIGWRLPTSAEWTYADGMSGGNWGNYNNTYASVLKLHAAGYLGDSNGSLNFPGTYGKYWSSTMYSTTKGMILNFYSSFSNVSSDIKAYGFSVRCLKDDAPPVFSCGNDLAVTHMLGDGVAPVTKAVNYGTVSTTLSGASKCWITQNLGADNQAASATDATDAAAGWYWQFNRQQGYAVGPTPAWAITSISQSSDWLPANDPCSLSLGAGWRIPTKVEWDNADGGWASYTDTYNSVLKLHAAGYLYFSNGSMFERSAFGYYWSSNQYNSTIGWHLRFYTNYSYTYNVFTKAYGFSLRCLKD